MLAVLVATVAVVSLLAATQPVGAAPTTKEACEAAGGTWATRAVPGGGQETSCTGAVPAIGMSLEKQVQSFLYYRTLGKCLVGGGPNLKDGAWFDGGERINRSHAGSGEWFGQGQAPGGLLLDGVNGVRIKVDTSGAVECAQSSLGTGALSLWDGWKPDEALCAMGMRSANDSEYNAGRCTNAQGGSDEFRRGDNVAAAYKKAVSDRIYGGKEPTITANEKLADAGKYLLYLKAFTSICTPTAAITTTKPAGTTEKDYLLRIPSRSGDTVMYTPTYYLSLNNKSPDHAVALFAGPSFDRYDGDAEGSTCGALAKAITGDDGQNNGLADAYGRYLISTDTPDTSQPGGDRDCSADGSCPETQPTCGNTVTGIGWIVCPVLEGIAALNDGMWAFTEGLLTVSPLQRIDESGKVTLAYQVWQGFQALANVALIIVFLVMIFSQLTSAGLSNYGVKKLLPRLVIAAIMINVSFIAMQLAVDVANVAGTGLYDIVNGVVKDATLPTWESFVGTLATLGVAGGIAAGAIAISPMAALMLALPLALGALLGFLAAVVTLMFRQAMIPLLAVLAPLAFIAYLLPNTKSWFDKWKGMFISMLMLFPLAALLFSGMKMAGYIINSSGQWWATLTALVVIGAPLFMLPFLARQAGPMLGKLQSAVRGKMGAVEKPTKAWADSHRSRAMAAADARTPAKWNVGARLRHGFQRRSRRRELETKALQAQSGADFNTQLAEHADDWAGRVTGDAAQAFIRGAGARAEAEELKTAQAPLQQEVAAIRAGTHTNPAYAGMDVDQFLEHRATDTTRSTTEREAAMHHAAALGRDGVVRRLGRNTSVNQEALQRAITANAGNLVGKAPDIVKGDKPAFSSVAGADMAAHSAGTAAAHMEYLQRLHIQANDITRTAAERADAQRDLDEAVTSFNGAVEDITRDQTLQAKYTGDTGRAVTRTIGAATPAFQAYANTHLTGLAAIQTDGKIR